MAGDWIKMRTALADDPAVICMADRLGMEEFAVVGRLHHLWSWADSQSRDGHAVGVTGKWLDRYVQRDGFAAAMVAVGWLVESDQGLAFPNFERHNGETAKARGLAANRQQKRRSSVTPGKEQMSRPERDEGVTREEKRREVKAQYVPPDPRQRFEMHEAWQPDEVNLKTHLRLTGVPPDEITPELLTEFIGYWITKHVADTHAGWCRLLVQRAHTLKTKRAGGSDAKTKSSHAETPIRGGAAAGSISLADNLNDRSWAEGAEPL